MKNTLKKRNTLMMRKLKLNSFINNLKECKSIEILSAIGLFSFLIPVFKKVFLIKLLITIGVPAVIYIMISATIITLEIGVKNIDKQIKKINREFNLQEKIIDIKKINKVKKQENNNKLNEINYLKSLRESYLQDDKKCADQKIFK